MIQIDKIRLDKINIVNPQDRKYNDNNYILMTFIISNAINPTFKIYAYDLLDAIETLFYSLDDNLKNLFFTKDINPDPDDDDYINIDLGYYLNFTTVEFHKDKNIIV